MAGDAINRVLVTIITLGEGRLEKSRVAAGREWRRQWGECGRCGSV
jgi:hypothetical protein